MKTIDGVEITVGLTIFIPYSNAAKYHTHAITPKDMETFDKADEWDKAEDQNHDSDIWLYSLLVKTRTRWFNIPIRNGMFSTKIAMIEKCKFRLIERISESDRKTKYLKDRYEKWVSCEQGAI